MSKYRIEPKGTIKVYDQTGSSKQEVEASAGQVISYHKDGARGAEKVAIVGWCSEKPKYLCVTRLWTIREKKTTPFWINKKRIANLIS